MAMIGRGAAMAEVGKNHHESPHGEIAYSAWLGVHASLMTGRATRSTRSSTGDGRLLDCLRGMDIWMQRVNNHYEYIAVYVDDLAIPSKDPMALYMC